MPSARTTQTPCVSLFEMLAPFPSPKSDPTHQLLRVGFGIWLATLLGCMSADKVDTYRFPDSDLESTAHGSAFTGHSMNIQKDMPSRPDWQPSQFYHRRCELREQGSHVSKTSYRCSDHF